MEASDRRIRLLRGLQGRRLVQVEYLFPSTWDTDTWLSTEAVDEVDMGVTMTFEQGEAFDLAWTMAGLEWSLEVYKRSTSEEPPFDYLRIDATGSNNWRPLVGQSIESVGVAEYTEEGLGTSLWSVRLVFSGDRGVVLSLGEVAEGPAFVTPIPDSLVVIFDEALARSFCPPGFSQSAWGRSV